MCIHVLNSKCSTTAYHTSVFCLLLQIFRVIPDPACAAWDTPRSTAEFDWQEGSYELFGRLRRAPGAVPEMTLEGWVAHWQMVGDVVYGVRSCFRSSCVLFCIFEDESVPFCNRQ